MSAKVVSSYDAWGAGRLDAAAAVTAVRKPAS
jgi:hypothetical protein